MIDPAIAVAVWFTAIVMGLIAAVLGAVKLLSLGWRRFAAWRFRRSVDRLYLPDRWRAERKPAEPQRPRGSVT